jgi:hypothetical protein
MGLSAGANTYSESWLTETHSGSIYCQNKSCSKKVSCPFKNSAYADKMLAPITGSTNRLMRLYERLGFIPMGDNEVVLVTNSMFTGVK